MLRRRPFLLKLRNFFHMNLQKSVITRGRNSHHDVRSNKGRDPDSGGKAEVTFLNSISRVQNQKLDKSFTIRNGLYPPGQTLPRRAHHTHDSRSRANTLRIRHMKTPSRRCSRDISPRTITCLTPSKSSRKSLLDDVVVFPGSRRSWQCPPLDENLRNCCTSFLNQTTVQNLLWNDVGGVQLNLSRQIRIHWSMISHK